MTKCEWIFLNKDGKTFSDVFEGDKPSVGDGKVYQGKGYAVFAIVEGRTTSPYDAVLAKEHD